MSEILGWNIYQEEKCCPVSPIAYSEQLHIPLLLGTMVCFIFHSNIHFGEWKAMFVGNDISKLGEREEHVHEKRTILFRCTVLSDGQ